MSNNLYADACAFIEGKYFPIAEARIPILNPGFTRSDPTYNVVTVWKGKFFRLDDHLKCLENSYTQLRMNPKISLAQMREILFEGVRRTVIQNAYED
jgi:branched-chain amino acid aminotransferase